MPHKIQFPQRRGSLHLPAHIYLSPVNVRGNASAWPSTALTLIPLLMHLLCLHWPPVTTHQLLFVFVAIGLLSTSIHLCLWGHYVNLKWLIRAKSTPKSNTLGTLLAYITHNSSWPSCLILNVWRILKKKPAQFLLEHEPRNRSLVSNCFDAVWKALGNIL